MTDDTISRQMAIDVIDKIFPADPMRNDYTKGITCGAALAKTYVEQLPTAERKGHWQITESYPHNVYCSECHTKCAQTHWAVWEDGSLPRKYCPNCGARMDGEQ